MIEEAPRRSDDDVHPALEHLDLSVDGHTAKDRSETKRPVQRVRYVWQLNQSESE
jgi:hypothetical protein